MKTPPIIEVSSVNTDNLLEAILQNDDENAKDTQDLLEKLLMQTGKEDEQSPILEHELVKLEEIKTVLSDMLNEYKKPCTVNLILE